MMMASYLMEKSALKRRTAAALTMGGATRYKSTCWLSTHKQTLGFCQLHCITVLIMGAGARIMCTFALVAMPLHCVCSPGRWFSKKSVGKNVPASQTKVSSVKNILALEGPNAWSEKELWDATTQARQHN